MIRPTSRSKYMRAAGTLWGTRIKSDDILERGEKIPSLQRFIDQMVDGAGTGNAEQVMEGLMLLRDGVVDWDGDFSIFTLQFFCLCWELCMHVQTQECYEALADFILMGFKRSKKRQRNDDSASDEQQTPQHCSAFADAFISSPLPAIFWEKRMFSLKIFEVFCYLLGHSEEINNRLVDTEQSFIDTIIDTNFDENTIIVQMKGIRKYFKQYNPTKDSAPARGMRFLVEQFNTVFQSYNEQLLNRWTRAVIDAVRRGHQGSIAYLAELGLFAMIENVLMNEEHRFPILKCITVLIYCTNETIDDDDLWIMAHVFPGLVRIYTSFPEPAEVIQGMIVNFTAGLSHSDLDVIPDGFVQLTQEVLNAVLADGSGSGKLDGLKILNNLAQPNVNRALISEIVVGDILPMYFDTWIGMNCAIEQQDFIDTLPIYVSYAKYVGFTAFEELIQCIDDAKDCVEGDPARKLEVIYRMLVESEEEVEP